MTTLSPTALRGEWLRLYKQPAPAMTTDLLRRGIAHRLQERALGGLPPRVLRQIERLIRQLERTGEAVSKPSIQIKPGTRLVRDWGGASHHVMVTDRGFFYRDQHFRSLTTIACEITGTRWSGPRFFGLKGKADA